MDLTKILQQNASTSIVSHLICQGQIFFSNLFDQLKIDLAYLAAQQDFAQKNFFSKINVFSGNLHNNLKRITADPNNEKKYLFLQLPFKPGFLLEAEKDREVYTMARATKVIPILNTELGDTMRPEIFILKSPILEEFRILDESFVRTAHSDKTLSVKQMSEMLLLLAESVREE